MNGGQVAAHCAESRAAPPPRLPDAATRDALRALLRRADYGEAAICRLLGVATLAEAEVVAPLALAHPPPTPLGALAGLLFAGVSVDAGVARDALGAEGVALLAETGLLAAGPAVGDGGALHAAARLTPLDDLLVASDCRARHAAGAADYVVGPAPVSRTFAELLLREPVARSLDLGCGAGVLALQAAAWSREVVAADLNPRAVACTAFNAALNGIDTLRTACGDLFAPLAGERFERIVCNPPFVISPAAGADSGFVYRDGGTAICRRIIDAAPDYLAPGGTLQMLCNWPEAAGGDWRAVPAAWFAEGCCDVWVLRLQYMPAALYASVWLAQEFAGGSVPPERHAAWLAHLASLGADGVGSGLVMMRPATGRRPWIELRQAPACSGAAGASLSRVFAARDALARVTDGAALLALPLRPAAGLQRRSTRRHDADGWGPAVDELRCSDGFRFAARVDPLLAELVTRLDGRRSVATVFADLAAERGWDTAALLPQLPAALQPLLVLGLLDPAA